MLKLFKHNQIDKARWNNCIESSNTPRTAVKSWYLDIVSPGWNALIFNDYQAVMPLPVLKKWGISFLIQPLFVQQAGIYGNFDEQLAKYFLKNIPKKYPYTAICLNEENSAQLSLTKFYSNYKLAIDEDYQRLYKKYNRNCKRKLKQAQNSNLTEKEITNIDTFITFFRKNIGSAISAITDKQYRKLTLLIEAAQHQNATSIIGIYDGEELVAVGLFFIEPEHVYFTLCASSDNGKEKQAMTFLVDSQVQKYAGTKKWYDFTGSNLPGIAKFNASFGANEYKYPIYKKGILSKFIK